jgi:hypothetical protein
MFVRLQRRGKYSSLWIRVKKLWWFIYINDGQQFFDDNDMFVPYFVDLDYEVS